MKLTMSGRIGALNTPGSFICVSVGSFFSLYTVTSGRAVITTCKNAIRQLLLLYIKQRRRNDEIIYSKLTRAGRCVRHADGRRMAK